ncbi:hypothetical protein E2C01_018344 [Portunus trituberculatus]|uniref:Uncharacterized protein n=1 Tax=Portunus trituberculatus TaxID=210409 RepID=A0A5B7DVW1_PORTR|nr:hypothetical protein [Portunus trituberculatus]
MDQVVVTFLMVFVVVMIGAMTVIVVIVMMRIVVGDECGSCENIGDDCGDSCGDCSVYDCGGDVCDMELVVMTGVDNSSDDFFFRHIVDDDKVVGTGIATPSTTTTTTTTIATAAALPSWRGAEGREKGWETSCSVSLNKPLWRRVLPSLLRVPLCRCAAVDQCMCWNCLSVTRAEQIALLHRLTIIYRDEVK